MQNGRCAREEEEPEWRKHFGTDPSKIEMPSFDVSPSEFSIGQTSFQLSTVTQNDKRYLVDTGSSALLFWDKDTQVGNGPCDVDEQQISYVGDTVCVKNQRNTDFGVEGAYVTKMSEKHAKLLQPVDGILGLLPPRKYNPDCSLPAFNTNGVAKALGCPEYYNVQVDLDRDGSGTLKYYCSSERLKGGREIVKEPYLNTRVHHAVISNSEGVHTLMDTGWPGEGCSSLTSREADCKTIHDCSYGPPPRVCKYGHHLGKDVTLQFSDTSGTVTIDAPSDTAIFDSTYTTYNTNTYL